ncbi:hypothetical protein [Microbispora sp. CSR-4]|uniref:hypothetical protein n=1 Tax=Microbispora sp. CSR-4 TaxID=2592813 RepID=UPI0016503706|nr:hypothetical protein [Microbispora sp. CSR-4]
MAGVLVTLALFVLVGYVVHTLRTSHRWIAGVLAAITTLIVAFPAVLYALFRG